MRLIHRSVATLACVVASSTAASAQAAAKPAVPQQPRPLRASDLYRIRNVNDPQLSPDGAWVAYTVSSIDSAKDKNDTDVWMVSWDGTQNIRLTSTPDGESSPRWSPDGRYLAFVSGRQEGKGGQIWLLDRRGGEAQRITQIRGGVSEYQWSPESKRLALIIDEETDSLLKSDTAEKKTPKPIVIDRYQFKRDVAGYLETKRSHLSVFDVASKKVDSLTTGLDDDASPSWSPDGKSIAFVRTPTRDPAQVENSDVYVIEARPGASPRRLTDFPGSDEGRLAWSPDGNWIAFTRGDEPKYYAYNLNKLAIVRSDGGEPARVVSGAFDRAVGSLRVSPDGKWVYATTPDDRAQHLIRIRVSDGNVERVVSGKRVVAGYTFGTDGKLALLAATPDRAPEIFAWENGAMRALTHQNDSLFALLQLGTTEDFSSRGKDGTEAHGLLVRPAGAV